MNHGEVPTEPLCGLDGRPAGLDPLEDQAVVGNGVDAGDAGAAGIGKPAEPVGLACEEAVGRFDDGAGAVGQPKPRRRADVAAGHRSGGDDRALQERFGTRRSARHPGHGSKVSAGD